MLGSIWPVIFKWQLVSFFLYSHLLPTCYSSSRHISNRCAIVGGGKHKKIKWLGPSDLYSLFYEHFSICHVQLNISELHINLNLFDFRFALHWSYILLSRHLFYTYLWNVKLRFKWIYFPPYFTKQEKKKQKKKKIKQKRKNSSSSSDSDDDRKVV